MLYNPTSIREFINHYVAHKDDFNPEFKWVNVHTNDFFPVAEELMETPRVIRLVDSILQKEAPTFPLDTNFSTGTFRLFHKFLKTKDLARPNEEQIQQIVLYLCATGYLIAERVGTDRKKRLPTFKSLLYTLKIFFLYKNYSICSHLFKRTTLPFSGEEIEVILLLLLKSKRTCFTC